MNDLPIGALVRLRTEVRRAEFARMFPDDWDRGGCATVSEEVEMRFGWRQDGGCYLEGRRHIAHSWNILPDGRILDVTADQFGEPAPGVRLAPRGDRRYDPTCGCGKDG